jgi:hypothetical protein
MLGTTEGFEPLAGRYDASSISGPPSERQSQRVRRNACVNDQSVVRFTRIHPAHPFGGGKRMVNPARQAP